MTCDTVRKEVEQSTMKMMYEGKYLNLSGTMILYLIEGLIEGRNYLPYLKYKIPTN